MPTATDTHERFITVVTTSDPVVIKAYLYDHTTIVRVVKESDRNYWHLLLRTTAETEERVDFLATYQRERLLSGLHGAGDRTHLSEADAVIAHLERVGVDLGQQIDHAELQRLLRGPNDTPGDNTADAHWNADRTGTVIYLGTFSRVEIGNDGVLWFFPNGGTDSDALSTIVGRGKTTAEVHEAARLFVKQYDVWNRTTQLLVILEKDVPGSVAHYAVEGAKKALKALQREAYTIDYFHGR